MNQPKVLVTGANGFVGQTVCQYLLEHEIAIRKVIRHRPASPVDEDYQVIGDISGHTDWARALGQIDSIIHLAARAHVMNDGVADPLREFRKINVEGTVNLAWQAARANVRRFIFISSIKVNGEKTAGEAFTETDAPVPQDPYGISKYEAEQALHQVARETGLEVVILRPPLIYGPLVKANFYQLMNAIYQGWPLPLGRIQNQRSLLYVRTFADAIKTCLTHPKAGGETFLVSDEESFSTPELITRLGQFLACSPRLLRLPLSWMRIGGKLLRKAAAIDKLTSSLVVDHGKIREQLNWFAPYSMDAGLEKTAEWFLAEKARLPAAASSRRRPQPHPLDCVEAAHPWQVKAHANPTRYKS